MNVDGLRQALRQTLENYQRCGLTRFHRDRADQLSADWLESIDLLTAQSQPPELVDAGPRTNSGSASQVAGASMAAMPHTRSTVQPGLTAEALPAEEVTTTNWQLPVLDEATRTQHLDRLNVEVKACRKCEKIVNFRQQTVFGVGPLQPVVCFVGEAPGADEDRLGEPFVGKAGQLLNKIINAMTLKREDVYILNALKCRPPQNRTPLPEEIDNCRHFVENQLDVLQPQYIVCLGAVAVRSILQRQDSIGRLRGRWHAYRGAKVIVTYHPSYLLRNESAKRLVWEDMKLLMREMGIGNAGK